MAYNNTTIPSTEKRASVSRFSYHRLRNEEVFDKEKEDRACRRIRKRSRFRGFNLRKGVKLRITVLRRLLRKRAKFFSRVKISLRKALKRLKNGQAHLNDLFGGNYLFMQAIPAPIRCGRKQVVMGQTLHGYPAASW